MSNTTFTISARDDTKAAFDSVNGALSKLSGSSVNLVNSMKGIGLAAVGLAGVGSMAAFKGQIDTAISGMAGLKDAAERTGASVENLSALKGIARIGDRDFAGIESAIGKLNKALHGTDDESKGAGKALSALGLSVQALRAMDPAEAFIEIARAQEKFTDGGGKSAAMMAILGKAGAEQIPFMHDLAEQHKLIGKVTTENAKLADDYEKNMKRLSASFSGTSRAIATDFLPWLTKTSEAFLIAKQNSEGFWDLMSKKIPGLQFVDVAAELTKIKTEFEQIDFRVSNGRDKAGDKERLADLQKQLNYYEALKKAQDPRSDEKKSTALDGKVFGKAAASGGGRGRTSKEVDAADSLIASLDKQVAVRALDLQTTEKLTAAEKESAGILQQLDAGTLKATASQRALIVGKLDFLVAADKEIEAQARYAAELGKAEQAMTGQREKMIESIAAAENQAEVLGLTESQISVVTQARLADAIAIAEANGASEESLIYLREELALRGQLTDALIKVDRKRIEQAGAATDQTNEFAQQAARNIQSSMADFLFDPFSEGADKMAAKFGSMIQRMAAEAAAAQIGKALFGDLLKTGGGSGSGDNGWIGQAFTLASSFFADGGVMTASGPLPLRKYDKGGVANSPQVSVWGEGKTPEAMVPLADGRTIPVTLKGGQGGMTINQTIYAGQGTDKAEVRRSAAAGARSALGIMGGAQRYA